LIKIFGVGQLGGLIAVSGVFSSLFSLLAYPCLMAVEYWFNDKYLIPDLIINVILPTLTFYLNYLIFKRLDPKTIEKFVSWNK